MRYRAKNKRGGASVVEFALVAPIFFLLLFGIIEYCRLMFTWQLLNNAAREGARYAVVSTATLTTANIQTYVNNYLAGQGASQLVGYNPSTNITVFLADPVTGAPISTPWNNAGWGNYIGVRVSGTYRPLTSNLLFMSSSFTLTGTCVMTAEVN
ncbi:MAG: pilus assembly protein [Planctomycetia bacterium]|nr:pilus assembly protein [Planctomycetia bacterium]